MRDSPTWFVYAVLGLAAWRVWHLLALDDVTAPIRGRLVRKGNGQQRKRLEEWIECPYCLGFWIALAWAGYVALWEEGAFWTALPFSFSTIIVAVSRALAD